MAGIITCLADNWLFITIKQVDFVDENTSWIFIHREQKCEEAYKDLQPHVQIDVTPSRLVFWPYIQNAQALFCILIFKEKAWGEVLKRHLRCSAYCSGFKENPQR